MKNKLNIYLKTIILLCLCIFLFSLFFATLYYFNIVSSNKNHIYIWILSIVAYSIAGFYLGSRQTKKALYSAICLVLCFSFFSLIFQHSNMYDYIDLLSKNISFILTCMIVHVKKSKTTI